MCVATLGFCLMQTMVSTWLPSRLPQASEQTLSSRNKFVNDSLPLCKLPSLLSPAWHTHTHTQRERARERFSVKVRKIKSF